MRADTDLMVGARGGGGTGAAVEFKVFEWSYIFDLTTSLNLGDT